jgi:Cu-processing system permease protein
MNPSTTVFRLALRELAVHWQSRWILITGGLYTTLSWAVAFYGFSFTGGTAGLETVLVSLVHLQLYTVPLLGLLLAYDTFLGERESGMFDLHLALGVSQWEFLLGKWLGLALSLAFVLAPGLLLQAAGLGAAGGSLGQFTRLLCYDALLGGAVVSTGLMVSGLSLNRGTVISLCIGIWLLEAVLLDFVAIGLLAATGGDIPGGVINALTAAHPLGAYRLLNYLSFFPDQMASLAHAPGVNLYSAYAVLAAWVFLPLAATQYRLSRTFKPVPLENIPC